jgi:monomeric isocitrate dehydrogenase
MTENEEKFLQIIKEKADSLDKRSAKFEKHLYSIESELKDIKKSLAYVKHKIGEHDEKLFYLSDYQDNARNENEKDIRNQLDFLTEKTAKTEREIFLIKKKTDY